MLVVDGEPVPYCLARIPQGGETRGNLAAGGQIAAGLATLRNSRQAVRHGLSIHYQHALVAILTRRPLMTPPAVAAALLGITLGNSPMCEVPW
ncbi:hypothetical protein CPI18_27840, partial [Klebsiella pneumoniae subsp. pneumoniae]|nr:hypothetical protein [Klebsiella pneumoniae subsp. pneumoniae]